MTFLEKWRNAIPDSLSEAVRVAQETDNIDFSYGLLATAVLWPVRHQIQASDPQAVATVQEISSEGKEVLAAVQAWDGDRLESGRALAEAARADANLRRGLRDLLATFDATHLLQEQLRLQMGSVPEQTIEQIQAALVNVGGVMSIDTLNLSLAALPEIPPPAGPDRPPATPGFVGREAELETFAGHLAASHAAVITGMAGVGKTALAAELARRTAEPQNIFWHTFHEGESIEVLIWELANFLAWNGQDGLWRQLQRAQQTGGHPPPETLFNYVIEMVRGRGYLFCLDDFQHVVADRTLALLVRQLRDLVQAGELQIIITSRSMPDFVEQVLFDPLSGLDRTDMGRLLAQRGLDLDEETLGALHASTGGNAAFLILAVQALQGAEDSARLVTSLARTADVERYLLRQVDEGLTPEEQALMGAVAVLLNYPGTRDALEAVLDGAGVWRPLQGLAQRHLLIVHEGEEERRYGQHDIVREFYYSSLSRRERQEMHCRAAVYYEQDAPDPLRAGLHYQRAGEAARAASILTADLWHFVNRGQARAVSRLLDKFTAQELEPLAWARVNLVLGRVWTILGEGKRARACLDETWDTLQPFENDEPALSAEVCLALGELLDQEAPQEALEWLQRGLKMLDGEEEEAAEVYIKLGFVHFQQGDFDKALQALEAGLNLLPPGPGRLRCWALTNLGPVYWNLGRPTEALEVTNRALLYSRRLDQHFRTADLLINLGIFQFTAGRWDEAIVSWEQGLGLAKDLGSDEQEVAAAANLGKAYCRIGDFDAARHNLQNSLELARKHDLRIMELNGQFACADLAFRRGDLDAAASALRDAETLAQSLDAHSSLVEIGGLLAEIHLAQERLPAARTVGERALQQARELKMKPQEGRLLRTLARVQGVQGRTEEALDSFTRSLICLEGLDPYEGARTRVAWGRFLLTVGEDQDARRLLQAARATFRRLGARRDLDELEEAMSHHPVRAD